MAPPEDFSKRDQKHLSIDSFRETADYVFPGRNQTRKPIRADYTAHAEGLLEHLATALGNLPSTADDPRLRIEGLSRGVIVEVSTTPPAANSRTPAVKVPAALEFAGQGIVQLRSERRNDRTESALIFVPDAARTFINDRIEQYGRDPGNRPRPDIEKFEVVERFVTADVAMLFATAPDLSVTDAVWWEFWLRQAPSRADRIAEAARRFGLEVHANRLLFPETAVLFIHGAAANIASFASRIPGAVSEIRRVTGSIESFLDRGETGVGPVDWVDQLAARVRASETSNSNICILDTGVTAAHPLLAPHLRFAGAYNADWGADDHAPDGGHGTGLASLALYGDLEFLMRGTNIIQLTHGVESMKLLPPEGFPPTEPPNYGFVTQGAIALVEIARPDAMRAFCLATSTAEFPPTRPSSWSGAIDQAASGAMPGDRADNVPASQTPKRLILVATGNCTGGMKDEVAVCQPLEDPAQSWNALSIGGYTAKEQIPAPPPQMSAATPANTRSPFSRGSQTLPEDLTPIKPEVLFEAGNMLADDSGYCAWHPAVSLLAAGSDLPTEPLTPFWATSAAVGVAGEFVGRLQAATPDLWPETHRALVVDSARWPVPIQKMLIGRGARWKSGSKAAKQMVLREMGYGVPDIARAIASARNDISLIAQAELQPYALGADGRTPVFNEMHFYKLPWPKQVLEALENTSVMMKVTLSYFIEPNLTGRAATRPDTYRSHGLRFAMKKRSEPDAKFRSRITAAQAKDGTETEQEADFWLLGSKAIQAGSLHCDVWRGHAVDLAGHDVLAVYPVGGWWKAHAGQNRATDTARYALVVSLSAPDQEVDLYAEAKALIDAKEIETLV